MQLGERLTHSVELERRHARLERGRHRIHRRPHHAAGVLQGDELLVALDRHAGICRTGTRSAMSAPRRSEATADTAIPAAGARSSTRAPRRAGSRGVRAEHERRVAAVSASSTSQPRSTIQHASAKRCRSGATISVHGRHAHHVVLERSRMSPASSAFGCHRSSVASGHAADEGLQRGQRACDPRVAFAIRRVVDVEAGDDLVHPCAIRGQAVGVERQRIERAGPGGLEVALVDGPARLVRLGAVRQEPDRPVGAAIIRAVVRRDRAERAHRSIPVGARARDPDALPDLNLGLMQRGYAAVAPAISNASRSGVTSPTVNGPNSP